MLLAPGRHVETVEFEQLGVTLHQIDRRFLGGLGDLPGDRLRFDAAFMAIQSLNSGKVPQTFSKSSSCMRCRPLSMFSRRLGSMPTTSENCGRFNPVSPRNPNRRSPARNRQRFLTT